MSEQTFLKNIFIISVRQIHFTANLENLFCSTSIALDILLKMKLTNQYFNIFVCLFILMPFGRLEVRTTPFRWISDQNRTSEPQIS